jgi:hypothetical protein
MRQCIVTAHVHNLTKVPIGIHIINIGIIFRKIYMKDLTITPMYLMKPKGQVNQIKMQIQILMHCKLNETQSHNQYKNVQ